MSGIPRLFAGTGVLPGDGSTEGLADAPVEIASPDAIDSPSDAPESGEIADDPTEAFAVDNSKPAFKLAPSAAEAAGENLIASPDEDEPAAEEASEFTPELLEQAKNYGFDEASAKNFGKVEHLQWAMAERDRLAAEWGQKQIAAQQQPAQQQFEQQPPVIPAAAPVVQQQQAAAQQAQAQLALIEKLNLDKSRLIEKGFDEDTIAELEAITGHFNGQLEKVEQLLVPLAQYTVRQNQEVTGKAQAEEQAQLAQGMDAYFNSLGPDWEETFGKGSIHELQQGTPAWNARQQVYSAMLGLEAADGKSHQQLPIAERAERALNALHFQKKQELDRKALADKAGKRRRQTIPRAGGQREQPMTGEDKAIARALAFQRKHQLIG